MCRVIKAPQKFDCEENKVKVFLAGSIEMGTAVDWQTSLVEEFKNEDCIFLNPRRDNWDSSWEQKKSNPNFNEQVNWELSALECSDVIVMYFDPNTKSPISLLELGLFAKSRKLIVYCPEGFWRKGNVDIVCDRYNVIQVTSYDNLIQTLKKFM